ncbi:hypothetical protein GCM10027068_15600 [Prescottella soli]
MPHRESADPGVDLDVVVCVGVGVDAGGVPAEPPSADQSAIEGRGAAKRYEQCSHIGTLAPRADTIRRRIPVPSTPVESVRPVDNSRVPTREREFMARPDVDGVP